MAAADGLRHQFMKTAMSAPFLEREEEHKLAQRWKNERDEAALHRLAAAHMRLVISIAARFRHYGLPMADLIQEGHVGLLEAAARFDPEREVRFSTYATWWIRAAIQDHILRNWSIVRGGTSSTQKALFFSLRRLRWRLGQTNDTLTTAELYRQIGRAIGVSEADVALMDSRLSGPDLSLNAPLTENDGENAAQRVDFLIDGAPLPDEAVGDLIDEERRTMWLRKALGVLSERELKIIRARKLDDNAVTLEALGELLGISKERVRQIENRALEKLKRALEAEPAAAFA
ncbi:RNA polymerase factor sigma-32 [Flaviflagellibacter deserti]|jgi:RNA polymerase sigma-32 factor|uniref:RNA polymerase factor sigma-32 n=1 Tax=Flaviflagellibacter deserti TaxID=2267266 RepID=A0ABV9Z3Z8_9HYPH